MRIVCLSMFFFVTAFAVAQAASSDAASQSVSFQSVGQLLKGGYEIKASFVQSSGFVLILQKDVRAFACEIRTANQSRCKEIK